MGRALRWGLLAAGLISHDFATALRSLPRSEHEIVAVAARALDRAQDFARRHEIPKSYGSYEELVRDPDVDLVYVGAQHPQHWRAVLLGLEAGKPVLCEKPLGVTATEVREMAAAARARGLFLMEAIWTRFFPATEALRALLSQGTLGEVRLVHVEFGLDLRHFPRATDWAQAGGALLDLGIYCLQFISMVGGGRRPERIHAEGLLHEKGVDDTVTGVLRYPGGLQASFSCSITTELSNSLTVFGTKGRAQVRGPGARGAAWDPGPRWSRPLSRAPLLPDPGQHVVPHGAGSERQAHRVPAARGARPREAQLRPFHGHGARGPARAAVSAAGPEGEPANAPGRERAPGGHLGGKQETDWAQVRPGPSLSFRAAGRSGGQPASSSALSPKAPPSGRGAERQPSLPPGLKPQGNWGHLPRAPGGVPE